MIIFATVNLKEILKKRKNICGSVRQYVRGVTLIRYGSMALCWRILMGLMMGSGLKDTDAQSAVQLLGCDRKVSFPDFNLQSKQSDRA